LVPKIIESFVPSRPVLKLGNLYPKKDFSDVRDVASIYRQLITRPVPGERINICSGNPISILEIVEKVSSLTGKSFDLKVSPELTRKGEPEAFVGDPTLLNSRLIELPKYSFEMTLQWMLEEQKSPKFQ
jgi:nucleoside-diphosphate-sugar epimerase